MINIDILKQYIEEPDKFMISYVPHEITRLGLDKFLDISIKSLDASKIWVDGLRPIQTTSYIYVRAITEIVYTINTYVESEEDKDKWFTQLLAQHNVNIEYEQTNPPVFYGGEKAEKKYKKSKAAISKPKKEKEHKETAAERKLAVKVLKINALSINFLPKKK